MEKISTDQLHTGYWSVLSSKSKFLLPMNVFMLTFRYKLVLSYEAHFFLLNPADFLSILVLTSGWAVLNFSHILSFLSNIMLLSSLKLTV